MRLSHLTVCLATTACTAIAVAQTPVAYVYVGEDASQTLYSPVYAYSASSSGRLTPLKGSPFTQATSTGIMLATNGSHFIFVGQGPNPGGLTYYNYLYSYSVGSDGVIGGEASMINTAPYSNANCNNLLGAEMDHTGQYIYVDDCDSEIETYKITKTTGALNFQNATTEDSATSPTGFPKIAGNSTYAYNLNLEKLNFGSGVYAAELDMLARQSDGSMEYRGKAKITGPSLPSNYYSWFSQQTQQSTLSPFFDPIARMTNDSTNHFAAELGINEFIPPNTTKNIGCAFASFTMGSSGGLTSTNTYNQMPKGDCGNQILLSPNGTVLAVNAGSSLYFLHFNGAAPMTRFASITQSRGLVTMAWDNANHVYALSGIDGKLHVYTVGSSSVAEAPGSPYSVPFCGLDENGNAQCPQTLIVRIIP